MQASLLATITVGILHAALELGAQAAARPAKEFRRILSRLNGDLHVRLRALGTLPGQQRFYLSGAVQALVLDKVVPDWKTRAVPGKATFEALLRDWVE